MKTSILMLMTLTLFFLSSVGNEANSAGFKKFCFHNGEQYANISAFDFCEPYHEALNSALPEQGEQSFAAIKDKLPKHGEHNPEDCVLSETVVGDIN